MSADKRKVSTDALETLGTILNEGEKRDAIHLAVLPVMAGARLYPGQEIAVEDGIARPQPGGLGIVDPFLQGVVTPEQRFWMVLKPRLVTSLRHVWSHPSFPDEPLSLATQEIVSAEKASALSELEWIADRVNCEVEWLIAGAHGYLDRGEYLCEGGRWEGVYLPDEFWPAFETYTGRKVPSGERDSFFSCSC